MVGLALILVPNWRHLGREPLLAAAVAVTVVFAVVAGGTLPPGLVTTLATTELWLLDEKDRVPPIRATVNETE